MQFDQPMAWPVRSREVLGIVWDQADGAAQPASKLRHGRSCSASGHRRNGSSGRRRR